MELTLETPVRFIPGVGPNRAGKLEILGIKTIEDFLFYIPFRYKDYSIISPVSSVQEGETVTIRGTVDSMRNVFTKTGKNFQEAIISDASGTITVIWFNQPYLTKVIRTGDGIHCAGKVGWFGRKRVMESPDYETDRGDDSSLHTGRLVPVYSETAGITSKWMRARIAFLLEHCLPLITDYLPRYIQQEHNLIGLAQAIRYAHFPTTKEESELANKRLSFDELFLLQLMTQKLRLDWERTVQAKSIAGNLEPFYQSLPFELTGDQKNAIREIEDDLKKTIPMNRLLEGDVGSGKTVVAAAGMYIAVRNGMKAVLMAPTQILAAQHYETIQHLLSPHGIAIGLVTANNKPRTQNQELRTKNSKQKKGTNAQFSVHGSQFDVIIGTHALLATKIDLANTGLIVIDEQQRFGVEQRKLLREKGSSTFVPHLLTMTATPIPRTIALVIYGNLDLTTLHQMPKGRQIVKTWVVPKEKREKAYAWIQKELREHSSQCFIVCPLIDESETLTSVRAVNREFEYLSKIVFPTLHLGLLHGRLKAKEKQLVLDQFRNQALDILVTTPVVEVGIDVPNATIMLIEAADRFGLAQLHQLRGRVGRGEKQSYCLLFTELVEQKILDRLKTMERVHNGPELAQRDLTLRGPGDVLGARQHGISPLRYASFSDTRLISETQQTARQILIRDTSLSTFPLLRERLKRDTIGESMND